MAVLLTVATVLGGLAALWYFWDKIHAWLRPTPSAPAPAAPPTPAVPATTTDRPLIENLIAELIHNRALMDRRSNASTPALRDEAWSAAHTVGLIPTPLRTRLNTIYANIRSAKDIHRSIEAVPMGADTMPEQIRIEQHLDVAVGAIPSTVADLRGLLS